MIRRIALTLSVVAISAGAMAQMPGTVPPGYTGPEFRDPRTGQIWTPDNVGRRTGPVSPRDRAFDPAAQTVTIPGVVDQTPAMEVVGSIPVTAGPTVPLVAVDSPTLQVVPGARWQAVIFLNNNAAIVYSPILDCRFTNTDRLVEQSRVVVPAVPGGTRVRLTLQGPQSNIFVDLMTCRVVSP